jgi:hypothetical protein
MRTESEPRSLMSAVGRIAPNDRLQQMVVALVRMARGDSRADAVRVLAHRRECCRATTASTPTAAVRGTTGYGATGETDVRPRARHSLGRRHRRQ